MFFPVIFPQLTHRRHHQEKPKHSGFFLVHKGTVTELIIHTPPFKKWWFFLFTVILWNFSTFSIYAVNPTSIPTASTNKQTDLIFPSNVLSEDGQIITPTALSTNSMNLAPGEPKPSDISPSQMTKKKAEALALYAEGFTFENNNEPEKALAIYEKVVALDPDFIDLRIKIGFEYLRKEQIEKATDIFNQIIKEKPDNASGYTALALIKKIGNKPDEAVKLSLKAIELSPQNVAPYQYLYEIYLDKKKYVETLAILEKASVQLPDSSFFWLRLGDMYAQTMSREPTIQTPEHYKKLEEIYNKAAQLDPENPEILRRIGDLYINTKDLPKARDIFNRLLVIYPEAARVREKLAYCYAMDGDSKMAISILESIIQRTPSRPEIQQFIGELKMENHDYDSAINHFEKSIELNQSNYELNPVPESPFLTPILTSYLQIALINLQKKTPENAEIILDKAEIKFPENPRISYIRGLIYREQKNYSKSIEKFEQTLNRAKGDRVILNSNFYLDYASTYEQSKNFGKAAEFLKKSIELDPTNHAAINYLGYMWADQNTNMDEAYKLIQKALELSPDNSAYLDSLGWIHFRRGNYKEALKYITKSAELIKYDDDIVLDHLAQTMEKLGDYEGAIKWWKKSLEINPEKEEYKKAIENLENRLEQTKSKPAKKKN